jgi:hypothetical protein
VVGRQATARLRGSSHRVGVPASHLQPAPGLRCHADDYAPDGMSTSFQRTAMAGESARAVLDVPQLVPRPSAQGRCHRRSGALGTRRRSPARAREIRSALPAVASPSSSAMSHPQPRHGHRPRPKWAVDRRPVSRREPVQGPQRCLGARDGRRDGKRHRCGLGPVAAVRALATVTRGPDTHPNRPAAEEHRRITPGHVRQLPIGRRPPQPDLHGPVLDAERGRHRREPDV